MQTPARCFSAAATFGRRVRQRRAVHQPPLQARISMVPDVAVPSEHDLARLPPRQPCDITNSRRVRLKRLKARAERSCGTTVWVISMHEAGLDGFWVHRFLEANSVESHVVDAARLQ
jgi:hypothetical protein